MKLKIFLTKIILVFALAVCVLSAVFLLYFIVFQNKIKSGSMPSITNIASFLKQKKLNQLAGPTASPLPVRLKIPKLNINAAVEYVGLTPAGAVGAPKGPSAVGWFELSSRPGDTGSSVIDGHSGYKNNKMAVFDNLHKLKKGDKIYVEDEKGKTTIFVVRKIKSYDRNADAADVFSSSDNKAHLNLVTCTGDWNEKNKTHAERLVVFTDKE